MKFQEYWGILLSICIGACSPEAPVKQLDVVPVPKEVTFGEGAFLLDRQVNLSVAVGVDREVLKTALDSAFLFYAPFTLKESREETGGKCIRLSLDTLPGSVSGESYRLRIRPEGVNIEAHTAAGLFYGVQTFAQLLTDRRFYHPDRQVWVLPVVDIKDEPAFVYRGLHLDVSRHFFPVAFIKKYIDLMAQYKFNTFHWHLTDAGGWRLQILKYPRLTEYGAWRREEDWRKWWNGGDRRFAREGDPGAYGGYYTQEEVREIVAYAAARHVRVIPEIEMPGHSEEVLAAYPELACFGHGERNGEFCAGKEETFRFVEDVLDEVIELFPSEYIHIGGDEASESTWKKCPRCQQRMRTERLKNEQELQSYFIRRVEKFVAAHGRRIIGWDEILEGGLAPRATVMSWRGEKGGIEAARSGHDVVMTPGGYCYFDSYQADPATQPYAIGGFLPYLKVYDYDPVPAELSAKEARHILGAQANLWTEYIATEKQVEYMVYPRALALSEVLWSPREKKDREDFKRRVDAHIGRLQRRGVNVFTLSDRVDMQMTVDTAEKRIRITFDSEKYRPEIRYTLDGSEPSASSQLYTAPFYITDSAEVRAALFCNGRRSPEISAGRFDYHKAIGKKVSYKNRYSGSYPASGESTLTDGYRGGLTYGDGRWQGFLKDLEVVVDLGEITDLHQVGIRFMQLTGPGVYMPRYVSIQVSDDGRHFSEAGRIENDIPAGKPDLFFKNFKACFEGRGRYVKVFARKQAGFLFTDEIIVY